MRHLIFIFILSVLFSKAQDKLFLSTGAIKHGRIISVASEVMYFKTTDTSKVEQYKKSELLLLEKENGERQIFAKTSAIKKETEFNSQLTKQCRNYLGMQPLAIFLGRVTFVYEYLTKNSKVGFVLPFSITFNPNNIFYTNLQDTSADATPQAEGLSYIAGADVNFYFGNKVRKQFFAGPRLRFGTDQLLYGTEFFSIQSQFGWRFNSNGHFTQHLSFGFGFVRILSIAPSSSFDSKQSYAWYSLNYRMGLRW